jgi:hypothetical protein
MTEPVTIAAVITGLVGAFKAYTDYKAATVQAESAQEAAPEMSKEAQQGETAAKTIKDAVAQHGDARDARAVESFEDDPDTYQEALQKVLTRLAENNPTVKARLQNEAQQSGVAAGIQGSVNVSGGKVDQAAGVNTGSMNYTASGDKDSS